jgi:catechol 2,3-dioxygenase-like lactoylglutathione lyase family enzyme
MLESAKLVGFIGTTNYDRAREFYEGRLGCKLESTSQFAMAMRLGDHQIRIVKIQDFVPVQNTVLGWEVSDIEAVVRWLQSRGVELEKYAFVQDRELGIWTTPDGNKVAWFKDPDGNVLSVSQHS